MRLETERGIVFYFPTEDRGSIAYRRELWRDQAHSHVIDFQFQHGPTGESGGGINGLMNEEVIELLLMRLRSLQDRLPCRENALAITCIESGLLWLQRRHQLRVQQGVYGTNLPHKPVAETKV